jgi:phosphoribosyl 1,2-cyclic phosphodiesterase
MPAVAPLSFVVAVPGKRRSVYPATHHDTPTVRRDYRETYLLEVTSLGSGSSGNALLIRTEETALLIDCGVGIRRLTSSLGALGIELAGIDAVLISHEHSDHIRELPRFVSAGKHVISTRGTAIASRISPQTRGEHLAARPIRFNDIEIVAIPVTHDAAEPCGFLVRTSTGSVTALTDLGCPSGAAAEAIGESQLVVLEANHDEALLKRGPYPLHLQRRILSATGHLSNADCGELLATALRGSRQLPTVWLAHLSETNNRPHLARQTVARRLAHCGLALDIQALPRRSASETWSPGHARQGVAQLALDL